MNQTYADKSFTTYLGFDKSSVTALIYGIKKIGLLELLKFKKFYHIAENILKNPKFGTDLFIVSIQSGEKKLCALGHDEGRFTGLIASEAAKRIVTMDLRKGMLGISDIISVEEVADNEGFGLTFS